MQRDEQFSKAERILKRSEFRQVYEQGQRYHFPLFTIFVLKTAHEKTRLGVTVTRRVGSAVIRNRCKRLLREVFRRNKDRLPSHLDLVVNVKQAMVGTTYQEVENQFLRFSRKLGAEDRGSQ